MRRRRAANLSVTAVDSTLPGKQRVNRRVVILLRLHRVTHDDSVKGTCRRDPGAGTATYAAHSRHSSIASTTPGPP